MTPKYQIDRTMSSDQPDVSTIADLVSSVRRDLDHLRRGEMLGGKDREEKDLSLSSFDSVRAAQAVREQVETLQEQVREQRSESLRAQAASLDERHQRLRTAGTKHHQKMTASTEGAFTLAGRVLATETGAPLPGVRVRGMEWDPEGEDDVLGEDRTDGMGFYRLVFSEEHFAEAGEGAPELFVEVLDEKGERLFASDHSHTPVPGNVEIIDVTIEEEKLPESRTLREQQQAELSRVQRGKRVLQSLADPLSILREEESESETM